MVTKQHIEEILSYFGKYIGKPEIQRFVWFRDESFIESYQKLFGFNSFHVSFTRLKNFKKPWSELIIDENYIVPVDNTELLQDILNIIVSKYAVNDFHRIMFNGRENCVSFTMYTDAKLLCYEIIKITIDTSF